MRIDLSYLTKEYNQGGMPNALADIEERAFYDMLKELDFKYSFDYLRKKLIELSKQAKTIVDDQAKFPE